MSGGLVWLGVLRPPLPIWICAMVVSVVVVVAWLAMFAKARSRLRSPGQHVLGLEEDSLVLRDGATERRIPWGEVETISVDEDRLVVRIEARGTEPLVLEPRYGGLGVYDLEVAVKKAHKAGLVE